MPKPKTSMKNRGLVPHYSFSKYYCADEQFVTFRYAGGTNVNATANYYLYQFRGNSPYDPDYTSTGAQPPGFDEWSAMYNRYRVYEYTFVLKVTSLTANAAVRACLWSVPGGSGAAPVLPTYDAAAGNRASLHGASNTGGPSLTLTQTMPVYKLWGSAAQAVNADDAFEAAISTNPTRVCWINCIFATSAATGNFAFDWELRMKTRLYQPQELALSLAGPAYRRVRHRDVIDAAKDQPVTTTDCERTITDAAPLCCGPAQGDPCRCCESRITGNNSYPRPCPCSRHEGGA